MFVGCVKPRGPGRFPPALGDNEGWRKSRCMTTVTTKVMIHDDSCGEYLDHNGKCPVCGFHPDMQSTAFIPLDNKQLQEMLLKGRTFLGVHRTPIRLG